MQTQPKSVQTLEQFNADLTSALQRIDTIDGDKKYLTYCIRDLTFIANSLIDSIAKNLHDKYQVYSLTTSLRLFIEIISYITYLKGHPDQAEKYWRSQESIQKKMQSKKTDDIRWSMYIGGDISYIGKLGDETNKIIKNYLGREEFGQYTFLNVYSHPNIAGYKHLLADSTSKPGVIVRFSASIFYATLNRLINELSETSHTNIDRDHFLTMAAAAHSLYFSEIGLQ